MSEKKETPEFKFKPKDIPTDSGCYMYYGEDNDLLYVGKAKNLRKRVSNYFQKEHESTRIKVMVKKIRRIETRIVSSEIEALILENNLIKEHMPRYNVLLRDDKNFIYLRITKAEEPKLEIVRKLKRDGATYIGPKTSSKEFRETVRFCQKHFGARMVKPGQDYYLNIVSAETISPEEYRSNIDRMKRFLKGQTSEVVKELQVKMMQFAADKNFEAAAKIRDLVLSIDKSTIKQNVEFTDCLDRDFISFVRHNNKAYFVRLTFRGGKLRDQNEVVFSAEEFESDAEVMEGFLLQFYEKVDELPREIYIPCELENTEDIQSYLLDLFEGQLTGRQTTVSIITPQIGDKKKALDIAHINAKNFCEKQKIEKMSQEENFAKALPELAQALGFEIPPRRIEGFDVSHLSGQFPVASQVVFIDGQPKNSEYRKYNIKSLPPGKIDDYASMKEVLERRFGRMESSPPPSVNKEGEKSSLLKVNCATSTRENPLGEKEDLEGLIMKPVETEEELEAYHEIRKTEVFDRYLPHIKYDPNFPDETKKKNTQIVFIHEDKVIGSIRLDRKGKKTMIIRVFAIRKDKQKQGFGARAIELVEDYCIQEERNKILINSTKEASDFYQQIGYEEGLWNGDGSSETDVPLGKKLVQKKAKWETPDLILLDGGKGQLSTVMKIFEEGIVQIPEGFDPQTQIIALAKREEQIFRPGKNDEPIELPYESSALKLLQRIRDESHRFAIGANRAKRSKDATRSILDEIPGIGPKTKKELMMKFESVSGIRSASDKELLGVLSQKQLSNLKKFI